MPAFKDANQREWLLTLDGPMIRQVREACKIDLGSTDGRVFDELESKPDLLVDVLWEMCREQASPKNITAADFGRSLVGDPIEDATKALTGAWLSFFPARKRSLLASLAQEQAELNEAAIDLAMETVSDPVARQQRKQKMLSELRNRLMPPTSATSLPESAESPPVD